MSQTEGDSSPTPVALRGDAEGLEIDWSDGVRHRLRWSVLREECPCAHCRARQLEPPPLFRVLTEEEAQPVRATAVKPLGNYAYQIHFNDGHDTGIYTLDYLRALGNELASGTQPEPGP